MYIHERENWPEFHWDSSRILPLLETICRKQGRLYGRLSMIGMDAQLGAMLENVAKEVVYSSEIEGLHLNIDQVRSSIARRLGIENIRYSAPSHYVDSVVTVMLEMMHSYSEPLSKTKLCTWQSAFFPTGYSEGSRIEIGQYRTHEEHIVSGNFGRERIHYIAPAPELMDFEMQRFIDWFDGDSSESYVIRSAIAHFWFVSIHPFEDGNGRMARMLSEMLLARGDQSEFRFYNISSQINKDKQHYYDILERTQHGEGDITEWLLWYLQKLSDALDEAETSISTVLNKSMFWQKFSGISLNERQVRLLNLFLDGYEAKITSKNWANLAKCSKDTAVRDIRELLDKNILIQENSGAKRPVYSIVYNPDDLTLWFKDIKFFESDGSPYVSAIFRGDLEVKERILKLDEQRYNNGELSLSNLLGKYFSYLLTSPSKDS